MSRRFGERNKLLVPVGGAPVVARTVRAYLGAGLDPMLLVVGYQARQIAVAVSDLPVVTVFNPDFEEGQSRALVRGVRALPAETAAAVIGVADQPLLTGQVVGDIVAAHRSTGARLVAPRYAGRRGNPVLFERSLFLELLEVTGDQGGRPLLERYRDEIVWVDVPDARLGADVDTLDDFEALGMEASPDRREGL
jgi:molybdenum cofactor cytidylyltransferase